MYLPPPTTLPPASIVDSYRRDSGGTRQDKSTDQQLAEIDAYCLAHNIIHRHRFVDDARSGGTTAGRDDFNRMMEMYATPESRPNGLILWNYARFARDIDDAQFNKIRLRQWGITVHSLNDAVPEGEYGRVIEFLIDVANEEKRKQTSTDAKRGLKDLVERYGCVPGTPPRGFKRTPIDLGPRRDKTQHIAHRWDPDPELIPTIQKAFALKAAGATLIHIQKETRLFNSLNSYKDFFSNQLYIGILKFGALTLEGYCPPIIDLDTWNQVQNVLALHADRVHVKSISNHPRRRMENSPYILSGLVYCGRCESPLYGMSSTQRDGGIYRRYACTRHTRRRDCDLRPIPAISLENKIIESISAWFDHPANLQALIEADTAQLATLAEKNLATVTDIKRELTALKRSINNITDAITQSGHSPAMLERLKSLESQQTELKTRLQMVLTENPTPRQPFTAEEITILSQGIVSLLKTKDPTTIRAILGTIVNKITIDRNPTHAFGEILIHAPDNNPPPNSRSAFGGGARAAGGGGIITAPSFLPPVGAPIHRHSISFIYPIQPKRPFS